MAPDSGAGLPDDWRHRIVAEVRAACGDVPVLLGGSRATGAAEPDSDCDVTAVLSLRRVVADERRLASAAGALEGDLGVPVTVHPLWATRLRHPAGSFYLAKLAFEADVLFQPPGFALRRVAPTGISGRSAASYLISAVLALVEAAGGSAGDGGLGRTERKAILHVGQVRLLGSGRYVSTLEQLAADGGEPELVELAGRAAASPAGSFDDVRALVLRELAPRPLELSGLRRLGRNLQYASLAALRRRPRWRAAFAAGSAEEELAAALVALLEALSPDGSPPAGADGLDGVRAAWPTTVPVPADRQSWAAWREAASLEWRDAHPLVALVP